MKAASTSAISVMSVRRVPAGSRPVQAIVLTSAARLAVAVERVVKRYGAGNGTLALDGISLTVRPGEFLTLVGASGCGKSTLLNLVSGLDRPTSGSVAVDGQAAPLSQEHALFPWLSALDNVAITLTVQGSW